MPKLKTHKGTAKRIRRTASGKLRRQRAFQNHFLQKKSSSRKRNYSKSHGLDGKNETTVKRQLGE